MPKQIQIKKSIEFLKNDYPENLIVTRKLPKKYQRITREKKLIYGLLKKRIKKIENTILKKNSLEPEAQPSVNKNIQILFSSEQYKNDVLKKQHQQKSCSDFFMKLKEKKKFSIIYGNTSKKFFDKAFSQAKRLKGNKTENLLVQYEKRLDVLLYRICFCKNIQTAKQYITHNLVYVNNKILNIPSYQVKAGDIISIDKSKHLLISNNFLQHLKKIITKRRSRFIISYKLLQKYLTKQDIKQNKSIIESKNHLSNKKKLLSSVENQSLNNKLRTLKFKLLSVNKNKTKGKNVKNYQTKNKTFNILEALTKIAFITNLFIKTKNKKDYSVAGRAIQMQCSTTVHRRSTDYTFKNYSSPMVNKALCENKSQQLKNFLILDKKSENSSCSPRLNIEDVQRCTVNLPLDLYSNFIKLKIKRILRRKLSYQNKIFALQISPMKPLHVEISFKLLKAIVLFSPQKLVYPTLFNTDYLVRS